MIKGFKRETCPLSDYEQDILLPAILSVLENKTEKQNAVKNKDIIELLKKKYKINPARLRKIINFIRINDYLTGLVATSKGYYMVSDRQELLDYEESLKGREDAIREVRQSIRRQRLKLYPELEEDTVTEEE